MLLDANVVGEARVFGLESLAADPLFVRLAGGVVPSIDTVYRDLCRFDDAAIADLETMMVEQGLASVHEAEDQGGPPRRRHHRRVRLWLAGGRRCPDPILGTTLARAITRSSSTAPRRGRASARCCDPGDTGLGDADAPTIGRWIRRFRIAAGGDVQVTMRIDAGGDCAAIYAAAHRAGARFIGKAKLSADLCGAIQCTTKWRTVERDAFGQPATQVAEISFARDAWKELGYPFRVVAMRTRERDNGKQIQLWSDLDYTVQAFVTNDWTAAAEDIAFEYDGRAEVEPAIGELKSGWGIGKIPSQDFHANHAVFLLKLLAHNLMRRFVRWTAPHLSTWRVPWLRRALINIPGRLLRSGRRWILRVPPKSSLRLD